MTAFFDFPFLVERVIPTLNQGLFMSLWLILPAAVVGGALGVCLGVLRVFGAAGLRRFADALVAVIRGVPLTVQLMILYFGLPYLQIYLNPYPAALTGFIFCTGAYQSEYVRGALLSIRQGQISAAPALGMTRMQIIVSVIVPPAMRRALPSCGNEIIYLIKYSSLAHVVTCVDLSGQAKTLISRTFRPTEVYVVAACYYLFLVTLATWLLGKLERKLAVPGFGKSQS